VVFSLPYRKGSWLWGDTRLHPAGARPGSGLTPHRRKLSSGLLWGRIDRRIASAFGGFTSLPRTRGGRILPLIITEN